jgi:hypothetical protein
VTGRSLSAQDPALSATNDGGAMPLAATSGTTALHPIVGPLMPPYEADVSVFAQAGASTQVRAPVAASDDPPASAVRRVLAARARCRADAGNPGTCRFSALRIPRRILVGVSAGSLATSVRDALSGRSADLEVQHVRCRPRWRCTASFTLDYGRYPMRVTYAIGGTSARGCWTIRGWSFTTAGPKGEALPVPSSGCVTAAH